MRKIVAMAAALATASCLSAPTDADLIASFDFEELTASHKKLGKGKAELIRHVEATG